MDDLIAAVWNLFIDIGGWFGEHILSIEIGGVSLLSWFIGLLVVSGLATLIISLRPSFTMPSKDQINSHDYFARRDAATKMTDNELRNRSRRNK